MTRITPEQIREAARVHHLESALIHALIDVESGGSGFFSDGSVKILFERHILWNRLQTPGREINPSRLARAHPEWCGPRWDPKQYPYGPILGQWPKVFSIITWAQQNDPEEWESYKKAALESCSYGLFQLLGYHYERTGFPSVYEFKHAMEESEARQMEIALLWMQKNGLLARLQHKDWPRFVQGYNGPANVAVYTEKLKSAYEKWSKEPGT
jgi:hypothetical protein